MIGRFQDSMIPRFQDYSTQEAPRRHPGAQRPLGGQCGQNIYVFVSKVARASVLHEWGEGRCHQGHQVPRLRTKVDRRSSRRNPQTTTGPALTPNRQNPISRELFGEKQFDILQSSIWQARSIPKGQPSPLGGYIGKYSGK